MQPQQVHGGFGGAAFEDVGVAEVLDFFDFQGLWSRQGHETGGDGSEGVVGVEVAPFGDG